MTNTTTTIWHNPNCSTSRKVLARLREAGHEVRVVEYLKTPPDRDAITDVLRLANLRPRDLLRRKQAEVKTLGLDAPDIEESVLLQAMIDNPVLIERPVVITARGVRLCRPAELVEEII